MMQYITYNLNVASTRHEKFEGHNYVAVPTVMLVEGVHNGTNGPLYYPASELAKTPMVWNYKPLVLLHPTTQNGEGVSACDRHVMERQKLGIIMNTVYDDKLKTEAWFDEDRIYGKKALDRRIGLLIDKGEMIETSTGLFTENEEKPGEWKGQQYTAIARYLRPDHLAVLPDSTGACSTKKGCGINRNEEHACTCKKGWSPEARRLAFRFSSANALIRRG